MKISKFTKIQVLIFAAAVGFFPARLMAHTTETHSTISALFHVEPNHKPVAGEPATISIELQDKSGQLSPDNCNCRLIISSGAKEVFSNPMFAHGAVSLAAQTSFTFPKAGEYNLSLKGEPTAGIEPFDLNYKVEVSLGHTTANHAHQTNHTGHYLIFGGGGIVLAGYMGYIFMKKKRQSP